MCFAVSKCKPKRLFLSKRKQPCLPSPAVANLFPTSNFLTRYPSSCPPPIPLTGGPRHHCQQAQAQTYTSGRILPKVHSHRLRLYFLS